MTTWEIVANQGGTIRRTLTFTEDNGDLIDLTDWTWRAVLRARNAQTTVAVPFSSIGPGVAEFVMDRDFTAALDPGLYVLTLDWSDAAGNTPEQELTASVSIGRQEAP